MQIFISWSGEPSHAVAVALREWLPSIFGDKAVPFVSSEDIDKGTRGLTRIADELEASAFGVIVVTPSNQHSTWVNFEAGALGKSVTTGRVAPLLVGMSDADLTGPLKQFQNSAASDKEAVRALVKSINKTLKDDAYAESMVNDLFNLHWPTLEDAITEALTAAGDEDAPRPRTADDILDEVLTTVRSLQRDVAALRPIAEGVSYNTRFNNAKMVNRAYAKPSLVTLDLIRQMFEFIVGDYFKLIHEGDSTIRISLQANAPQLSPSFVNDLSGLARNSDLQIIVSRPDGSWVAFDRDGTETRGLDPVDSEGNNAAE